MLMLSVVHPDAFDKRYFSDPSCHLNTEMFLRGVDSNGLILVDAEDRLFDGLIQSIEPLASLGKGKRTHALFEELLKKRRRKVLRIVKTSVPSSVSSAMTELVVRVFTHCRADLLLVAPATLMAVRLPNPAGMTVISVPEYISSPTEAERHRRSELLPPVDMMPEGEFNEHITRCVRFSRWLRFYDKQIGNASSLVGFRRGIAKILELWLKSVHFATDELMVELLTCVPRYPTHDPMLLRSRIYHDLIEPLREQFRVQIKLHFKLDNDSISHDRYLQGQSVALCFSKGFDFVNKDGSLHRTSVKIDNGVQEHLREYRDLPEFIAPA